MQKQNKRNVEEKAESGFLVEGSNDLSEAAISFHLGLFS